MRNIKVKLSMHRIGYVEAVPVSEKVRKQYAAHMKQFKPNHDGTAFFHSVTELNESGVVELLLLPSEIRHLSAGWPKTVLISAENFGHLLGYDSNLLEIK